MDEIEFRKRVYTNPQTSDQEVLDAAGNNPVYQKILDQTQELDTDVTSMVNNVEAPAGLKEKLLAIPSSDISSQAFGDSEAANSSIFQYYALAATLLLAIGVTFSVLFNTGPSTQDIAFGDEVLEHLYIDSEEIDAFFRGNGNNFGIVNAANVSQVMASAGTQLINNNFMQNVPIRVAKPCEIIPAYKSAHLIMEGSYGAVSVIVINNSPVDIEYQIRDDRFNGVVMPMGDGNIILIGEENEDLDQYKDLFTNNVDWVI